jgi:dihydrofolate synthase / folylpolyglutamate synthase
VTYQQTLDYIFAKLPMYQRVGAAAYKADLDNTIALCAAIGNPHEKLRCIHVAGTNGKGSVSHIMASCLQSAGYRTGLYVSPHYKDFRERIKINGVYVSEHFVVKFIDKIKPVIERISPSFFEITVAMAFAYFEEEKVDFAVIETGLGGRLDSTNIITPLISVITNISYDHVNLLGDTLAKIASEKAGIIKEKVSVIIGEKSSETDYIFIEKAKNENANIFFAEDIYEINNFNSTIAGCYFDVFDKEENTYLNNIQTDISGPYQLKNLRTALSALKRLEQQIPTISSAINLSKGLRHIQSNTAFIGRWNLVQQAPLTILDSAHNEAGIQEVLTQLKTTAHQHLHWVYGTVNDKDINKILALLPKENTTYYFCKPSIPRGLDEVTLQQTALSYDLVGMHYPSVNEAFKSAKKNALPNDVIIVCGSIFVVAEVI